MSGVAVIRQLLLASEAVTDLVPAERIAADIFDVDTPLPAIRLESIDGQPLNTLAGEETKNFRERVQVKPLVATYPEIEPLQLAILSACADKFPVVEGVSEVSVLASSEGPDGFDTAINARTKSQDFIVRYNRPV
jgi:hypothetical protein